MLLSVEVICTNIHFIYSAKYDKGQIVKGGGTQKFKI